MKTDNTQTGRQPPSPQPTLSTAQCTSTSHLVLHKKHGQNRHVDLSDIDIFTQDSFTNILASHHQLGRPVLLAAIDQPPIDKSAVVAVPSPDRAQLTAEGILAPGRRNWLTRAVVQSNEVQLFIVLPGQSRKIAVAFYVGTLDDSEAFVEDRALGDMQRGLVVQLCHRASAGDPSARLALAAHCSTRNRATPQQRVELAEAAKALSHGIITDSQPSSKMTEVLAGALAQARNAQLSAASAMLVQRLLSLPQELFDHHMDGSLLLIACKEGDALLLRTLIEKGKCSPNAKFRNTPILHLSARYSLECAKELLNAGADPLAKDSNGKSAAHTTTLVEMRQLLHTAMRRAARGA